MNFIRNKLAVIIVLLSVTFLILIGYSVRRENRSFIENGAGVTLNSVQGVVYKINSKINNLLSFAVNFSEIKKENEALKARNSELEEKALNYDSVKSENETLRAELDFKNRNSHYTQVACHIIGRGGGSMINEYAIDKGSKAGITKGMPVVTAEGLVGQVYKTSEDWSTIMTLADENIAVAAMVANAKENDGIVKGYKDGNKNYLAKIYHLPLGANVNKGDVIVTSGKGNLYPAGIRIGSVTDVEEDNGKIEKNAVIQPYVDFNKLEMVLVIVSKDNIDIQY